MSRIALPLLGVYSVTKFAARDRTRAAVKEYASADITANTYCPDIIDTDMWVEIDRRLAEITEAKIEVSYSSLSLASLW